ncbi:hypothetical protein Tcan_00540, partial [Toxocara canis]
MMQQFWKYKRTNEIYLYHRRKQLNFSLYLDHISHFAFPSIYSPLFFSFSLLSWFRFTVIHRSFPISVPVFRSFHIALRRSANSFRNTRCRSALYLVELLFASYRARFFDGIGESNRTRASIGRVCRHERSSLSSWLCVICDSYEEALFSSLWS